ncbi:MAG: right-handed parallel beta-helix repeat-containing protein [Phycisphaerae bacterium]|nr:right-handed parallel beta-helix repeat-containing protein [Saprospiraceae bacterium]
MKYLTLLILLQFPVLSQAQIHLGPNQPYPNIQAAANAIQPGDTVYLHAGSYAGYQAITDLKGTATAWITITRYQNDVIDISGGWQFIRCEYLRFKDLNFKGNAAHPGRLFSIDNGGSCTTQSNHILVDRCSFSNTTDPAASVAFKFAGVDHFEVSNCVFKDIPACEAMSYNTCHEGIIHNNRFENCLSGGHIKGGASNITLTQNLFMNASQSPWVAYELGGDTGAAFYCVGDSFEVKNLKFYSNIIMGGYRGLALSSAKDCKVINNTFYNCGQATMRFLTTSNFYPTLSGNQVENNLFAFGTSAYINGGTQPAGAATFSHNIYFSLLNDPFIGPYWDTPDLDPIKDPNPLIYGSNIPMFVDGPGQDFHLLTGSPAVGNGKTQMEPVTDFYGKPFSASARSIGAIEIEGSSSIPERIAKDTTLVLYPNPATDYIEVNARGIVEIWNTMGVKLLESSTEHKIFIGELPPGVYFLASGNRRGSFLKR